MIKKQENRRPSLFEFMMNPKNFETRKKDFFEAVNKLINWNKVEYRIEALYNHETGRPAFPALMMFKALLLASWYGLSDPELEDCLKDRLSFKIFVGLSVDESVPDETTLCRFRNRLAEKHLMEKLFKIVNEQLEGKGLFIKKGTLIDASIHEAEGGNKKLEKRQDKEATWTKKNDEYFYGYKGHAAMDYGSDLIHHLEMTTASVHDSRVWDELLTGEEKAVFADKGYYDSGYKEVLRRQQVYCGILDKANSNHPLTKKQFKRNVQKSRVRSRMERFWAAIKDQYNFTKIRFIGLAKNRQYLFSLGIAFNLQQAVRLMKIPKKEPCGLAA
jgi:IS5 family transposase